ncbi:MAG: hypothetical protein ACK4VM_01890 [Bosea sp. (in: a-proteobacteria)]
MIRFRTIDPAQAEKPAEKPVARPPAAVPAPVELEDAAEAPPQEKAKGLTRKTPLRAKKPEPAKLFDT